MSSSYHIRKAEKDDLPAMIEVSKRAFAGGAMSDALFPEHLRTEDTENEKVQFHLSRHVDKIYDENRHYLVVVDDKDTIAGIALWQTYVETGLNDKEAEEAEKAELRSHFPKSIDLAAAEKIEKLLEVLKKTIKDALGQEEFKNSWSLETLAVDPDHQRKGIGKMLMQWGEERAAQDHKNIHIIASEAGANLYRSLGFEEVGSVPKFGATEYAFIKKAK